MKTQQVVKSRDQHCWEIEIEGYLSNESGPLPLVLDLRLAHERWGRSADPTLNGNLHYSNDQDRSFNEEDTNKIRKYRSDYNNRSPNVI